VLAVAWVTTGLRPFTAPALVATVGAGLAALALGARRRPSRPPPEQRRGAALWAVSFGVLAAWEFASYLQHPRSQHPTLSSYANTALAHHPVRAAGFVAWLGAGLHLARR